MKSCKKCMAGEIRANILPNGLCEECEHDRAWNNKAEERRQREMIARMHMRKKAQTEVNRRWKEKYGDATAEEVASYL